MPRHDSSVLMLVNVLRAIIILLLISFSDLPSSVIKLPRYTYDATWSICSPSMAIFILGEFGFLIACIIILSVGEHLPRLNVDNEVFAVEGELPDECIISIQTTFKVLSNIKPNKASGPYNIPAWKLKDHADLLAPPLAAIFNCLLREGKLPNEWKMANIIPLPKSIDRLQFIDKII